MKITLIVLHLIILLFSCQQKEASNDKNSSLPIRQQANAMSDELLHSQLSKDTRSISYKLVNSKEWLQAHKTDTLNQRIVFAINRTDQSNFTRLDTVIVPNDFSHDLPYFLPFPLEVNYLKDISKIIYFSYPTQTFAAYEKGILKRTGPTNMGREEYLTPTGLFFTNWKAKVKVSSIDEDWILRWNFNILNKEGIGWHQYSLPGHPISHSCLRLQEKDAYYLYNWADQWILADKFTVLVKGTPVIVFGAYDFSSAKPWLKLISNPNAIDITKEEIEKITKPYLNDILAVQKNRDTLRVNK
jgi:hypothetical protein